MTQRDDAIAALRVFPDLGRAIPLFLRQSDDAIDELCKRSDPSSEESRNRQKRRLMNGIKLEILCGRLIDTAREQMKEPGKEGSGLVIPWIYRNIGMGPRAASAVSTLTNDLIGVHGAKRVTVVSWLRFGFGGLTQQDPYGLGYDPMGDMIWLSVDDPSDGWPIIEVRGNGTFRVLRTRFAGGHPWDAVSLGSYPGVALVEILARGEVMLGDADLNACFPPARKSRHRSESSEALFQAAVRAVDGDRAPRFAFVCGACASRFRSTVPGGLWVGCPCGGDFRFDGDLPADEQVPGSWIRP